MFPPERLDLASRYADLLATDGVERGLIGPREVPRLWERHVLNCAVVSEVLPEGATVCDIGSGAGLPGLVLAIARPDLRLVLVEPLLRRTTFLEEVVTGLGLDHVRVERGRAEALHGRERFDVVTSRAVAPLDRLLGWSMPLVDAHGAVVAMKGSSAAEEVAATREAWQRLGCARPEVLTVGSADSSTAVVVRVAWADPARVSSGLAADRRSAPRRSRSRSGSQRRTPPTTNKRDRS